MCKNVHCPYAITNFHTQDTVLYCMFYQVGVELTPTQCELPDIIDDIDDVITLTDEVQKGVNNHA